MAIVTWLPAALAYLIPIGLFLMEDRGRPDHKILDIPVGEPVWREVRSLDQLPGHLLREIEHFFAVYKDLEEQKTAVLGWRDLAEALDVIETARRRAAGS